MPRSSTTGRRLALMVVGLTNQPPAAAGAAARAPRLRPAATALPGFPSNLPGLVPASRSPPPRWSGGLSRGEILPGLQSLQSWAAGAFLSRRRFFLAAGAFDWPRWPGVGASCRSGRSSLAWLRPPPARSQGLVSAVRASIRRESRSVCALLPRPGVPVERAVPSCTVSALIRVCCQTKAPAPRVSSQGPRP